MVHFKTLFAAVLSLSVATCNPVDKRDAALVLTDLTAVGNALTTLTASVTSYTGGLTGAITISTNGNTLDTAINKATTDANSSAAFTAAQSASITSSIGTLTPQIQSTLTALVNKEPLFDASALDPLVLSQLNTLLADSDKLGVALQAKAVAADVVTLKGYQSTIDTSFAFAIAVFT
ncbi:hydrophobic surface binding protein A-domain-containing protein [Leptodontidium sp. MPI-SDFR-AT-0119]|nr:hydrophobic surface binding protein A-domain-containing protein [Leptodontidium sp. MPI-SDFR-AT-0119]